MHLVDSLPPLRCMLKDSSIWLKNTVDAAAFAGFQDR